MINTPPSDPKSSRTSALGFDEFIAILVAFATIGAILFWAFSRRDTGWNFSGLLTPSPTPSPRVQPNQDNLGNLLSPSPVPSVPPNAGSNPKTSPAPGATLPETSFPFIEATPTPELPPVSKVTPPVLPGVPVPIEPNNAVANQLPVVTPSKKKSTIPPPIAFTDVPPDYWGKRFIDTLSSRNIIRGFPDYSFRPNQPVNRAEYAAILQQAFDKEIGKTSIQFQDVPAKYWATPAIDQAISTGFLKGYPDKTFKPDQRIPRVQVLVALVSGLNLKEPASPEKLLSIYKDAKDIPQYAIGKVAAATANGLVVNYPDASLFEPNKEATRAEVAAMIHQGLVRMGRLQPIASPNIVRPPK
ncbi:MAG: S-layer homology domain-containing protein [Heteroscytonema crispum UTEX LB 1556]